MTGSRTAGPGRLGRLAGVVLAAALGAGVAGACGAPGGSAPPGALPVVATTTVLADLVRQVGGERVSVASLVPKGGEVHTFDPRPADAQRLAEARLILVNGLGLDDWLEGLAEDAGADAPIVALGEDLVGVDYIAGDDGHGAVNPHLWLDAAYAMRYVDRIEEALSAADPAGATAFAAAADAYRATLADLDDEIRERVASVPAGNRTVVSFHEAFPYFAVAYGLTIAGTIVDAPGQDPSAGALADLVSTIRETGARAIFAESQFNPDLADTIAAETGATVVTSLYTDSVGDPPADTYAGLMRWNVDRVIEALAGD